MIPGDLASRLRILLENTVQPVTTTREIGRDPPGLQSGLQPDEGFTAQIQNALPDGSFRALVAGRSMTLAPPDSAKAGDVLELTVTSNRGGTVFARLGKPSANTASGASRSDVHTGLSNTAQLISQLLTGNQGKTEPLPLGRCDSLMPASRLAQQIIERASEAGVFVHESPELVGLLQQVDLDDRIPHSAMSRSPNFSHGSIVSRPIPQHSSPTYSCR